MSDSWHSCISEELELVEQLMEKSLRSENPELEEMCHYVIGAGGKRIRPALSILSYYACGGTDKKKPASVGAGYEIIHSATLIHDDINDQGEIRRGRKTLHKEYTISKAIIAGDYMFAMGFRLLSAITPKVVEYVVEASASMGAGEFVQKDFEHASRVTEEDYIRIITDKTAKLFEAAAKSGAVAAKSDADAMEALGDYARGLGIAFQIVDDTLDVAGDSMKTGKTVGTDMIEGKPTLPVIYAMENPTVGQEIRSIFEKAEPTEKDVVRALELINRTDAVERCMKKATTVVESLHRILDCIPSSVYKNALLGLADYVVSRERR